MSNEKILLKATDKEIILWRTTPLSQDHVAAKVGRTANHVGKRSKAVFKSVRQITGLSYTTITTVVVVLVARGEITPDELQQFYTSKSICRSGWA